MTSPSKPKKRGRPTKYNEQVAKTIVEGLKQGKSLKAVCRQVNMPSDTAVRGWALDPNHPFSSQYTRAREIGYHKMADDMIEIADDADPSDVQVARLRCDKRQWMISKMLPKLYGDKLQAELSGPGGGPIQSEDVPTRDLARAVIAVLAKAQVKQGDDE